jgi:membrane protease YdiL (CAAX protease family)
MSVEEYIKAQVEYDPESPFWKPDKIEFVLLIAVALYAICITYNITMLLNLNDFGIPYLTPIIDRLRDMVWLYFGLGMFGLFGLAMRGFSDRTQLLKVSYAKDAEGKEVELKEFVYKEDDKGKMSPVTLTSVSVEGIFNPRAIGESFFYFAIAFGINSLVSFLIFRYAMTIFTITSSQIAFAVITGVAEELLFSYGFQRVFEPYVKTLVVPLTVGLFVIYHVFVYQQDFWALVYVAIGRLVYSIIYLYSRRISSVMLAHVANNILAFQNTAPAFSVFSMFLPLL